jgi:uncharacterized lipoprotein YmbA
MGRYMVRLISIALTASVIAGCGTSASSRFYTLDPTASSHGSPVNASIIVGPVTIPASVDQPQFVVQVASNRVEVDEFNRWVAPLSDGIARAVAGDLAVTLDTPVVATAPMANFSPDYRVAIDVQRFESVVGQEAVVDAVWTVRKTGGGEARSGRTLAREPIQGDTFEAIAAAHSRALARVSDDIAAAIRAEAEAKP